MFDDDPRRDAWLVARHLPDSAARRLLCDLVRGRDDDARRRLRRVFGAEAELLDLRDGVFREWLLESLEYRISPPDDEDPGPALPDPADAGPDGDTAPWTAVFGRDPTDEADPWRLPAA
ncbi:MAG: hypothetical protein R3F59_02825 [Myxococcota bacterium]